MRSPARALVAVALAACAAVAAAADVIAPNAHLVAENIPPIPAALAAKVAPYTEFKPALAVSWHPVERELVVARRAVSTTQLHRVAAPGGELVQVTDFAEPVRFGLFWPTAPDVLIFTRDSGGNEQRQIYRQDPGGAAPVLLTDAARKNDFAGMTRARERLFLIEKSCAGVNFMLAAFGMLVFTLFHRVRTVVSGSSVLGVSLLAGFAAAVVVNAVRIAMAMWLAAHPIGLSISSAALHRLEGILVYFGGLVLLYEAAQRLDRRAILWSGR